MKTRISLLVLLFSLAATSLYGQRRGATTYQSLLMRTDRPSAYFDHVSFPVNDSTAQFAFLFRMDYDSVPFLKTNANMQAPSPDAEYYGNIQIGLEVFEGEASRRSSDLSKSLYRDSWQDTLWVDSYEKTTSRTDYTQGLLSTTLQTGDYHYEFQLPGNSVNIPGSDERSPGSFRREIPTPTRNISLTGSGNAEQADFILLKNFQNNDTGISGTFLNFGDNVLYGQDYGVLVRIPGNADAGTETLTLNLYRITGGGNSDSRELRHSQEISAEQVVVLGNVNLTQSGDEVGFQATPRDNDSRYAYVEIPNNNFENSTYQLTLENAGEEVLGEKRIRSQWLDMPVSLYNLNVAIDMLRYIVNDDELDRINSGSDSEREQKFREFWAQRDPTPETEFNELMTEYYKRIDYAYNEFSSLQVPGYETDQGKAYILYGPPDDVERRLPTDAPTREVWHYPNRTLIFEATTGFGDFKLVSEQQS